MFHHLSSQTALLYVLSQQRKQPSRAFHLATYCLKWGQISVEEFFSLASDSYSARENKAGIRVTVEEGVICVQTLERQPYPPECSELSVFREEVTHLKTDYLAALGMGLSFTSARLSPFEDSWKAERFLLEILALTQDVTKWNLGNCWGLLIELGFGQETDLNKTKGLLFQLQEGVSAGREWDDGMIGQVLGFVRTGSKLTFSLVNDELASCDVHDFLGALLESLVRYEDAVSNQKPE